MSTAIHRSRSFAFQHQNGRCFYCRVSMWLHSPTELGGVPMSSKQAARLRCTAEHLKPKSEGGLDTIPNIAAACAHCNHTRHKRKVPPHPDPYMLDVRRHVERGAWHHSWVHDRGLIAPP